MAAPAGIAPEANTRGAGRGRRGLRARGTRGPGIPWGSAPEPEPKGGMKLDVVPVAVVSNGSDVSARVTAKLHVDDSHHLSLEADDSSFRDGLSKKVRAHARPARVPAAPARPRAPVGPRPSRPSLPPPCARSRSRHRAPARSSLQSLPTLSPLGWRGIFFPPAPCASCGALPPAAGGEADSGG